MCDECGLQKRQVANSLKALCSSLAKAVDTFDRERQLTTDELDFAVKILANIKDRCQRFRGISEELPRIEL
jgi:hypothetical protein